MGCAFLILAFLLLKVSPWLTFVAIVAATLISYAEIKFTSKSDSCGG